MLCVKKKKFDCLHSGVQSAASTKMEEMERM